MEVPVYPLDISQHRSRRSLVMPRSRSFRKSWKADPATDWGKVNIEALRQHLIDMDNVTLRAELKSEPVEGGMRFIVSGVGPVKESIQRMVSAHAATMNGVGDWKFNATATEAGAILTVVTPSKDTEKLRGLGFIGVMTHGMHP